MTKIPRRELLQLAKPFKHDNERMKIAGWYISEKLDGTRCFWDGGVTRGMATAEVPWAGLLHPKTLEPKTKIKPYSTGLWSRYGNPIIAPDWFLDLLPKLPLDGELWCGRGNFQLCRSIISGDTPDPRWDQVKFAVYGSPAWQEFIKPGLIKNNSMYCEIPNNVSLLVGYPESTLAPEANFEAEMDYLSYMVSSSPNEYVVVHEQFKLADNEEDARQDAAEIMAKLVAGGAEGAILRNPYAKYACKRVADLLKLKPSEDAEATITGYTAGRMGKKGLRFGKIGALVLDFNGQRLELSGLNTEEQEFEGDHAWLKDEANCGKDVPDDIEAVMFKRGQQVTFKYRELSDDGIPKEARYWRPRTNV